MEIIRNYHLKYDSDSDDDQSAYDGYHSPEEGMFVNANTSWLDDDVEEDDDEILGVRQHSLQSMTADDVLYGLKKLRRESI